MADHISKERRSWNMRLIRSKHTKPELVIRSLLHSLGYRFRINSSLLPGKPDIVLPKYRTVIFVHGCFWHRHKNCKKATTPSSNREYWKKKFEANQKRDENVRKELRDLKWSIIIIWECELLNDPLSTIKHIDSLLGKRVHEDCYPQVTGSEVIALAEKKWSYILKREKND